MNARLAAGLAIAAVLALPAGAGATTYCVNKPACVAAGGTDAPGGLQAALTAAQNNGGPDRVEVGAGDYPTGSGFTYVGSDNNPVEIVGAGMDQTTVVAPNSTGNGTRTLRVTGTTANAVTDLSVTTREPSGAGALNYGLALSGTAQRVHANARAFGTAVDIEAPGGALLDSRVNAAGTTTTGVRMVGFDGRVERSDISSADIGVNTSANTALVFRTRIAAAFGVKAFSLGVTVDSSVITPHPDNSAFTALTAQSHGKLTARHVTVDGADRPNGTGAYAFATTGSPADVVLQSSVLSRLTTTLKRESTAGNANIEARNSNYESGKSVSGPGPGTLNEFEGNMNVAPGFVDQGAGDYRLRADSAMVDAAPVAPAAGVPAADFTGGARAVEGNGDGTAAPDVGAFEFVSQPPTALIAGPDTVEAGRQGSYSGGASSDPDPGDSLTYSWNTQGPGIAKLLRAAATSSGPDLTQAFPTPGSASVALTVTDRSGRTDTTAKTVNVVDTTLPVATDVKVTNRKFAVSKKNTPLTVAKTKRGTKFQFALSEPAAVAIEIQRVIRGRLVGKKCRASARTGKRCTVYKRVGILRRPGLLGPNSVPFSGRLGSKPLAAGGYRALVRATDASNNTSAATKVGFTVVRP